MYMLIGVRDWQITCLNRIVLPDPNDDEEEDDENDESETSAGDD